MRGVWDETPVWLRGATKWSESFGLAMFAVGVGADAFNWTPSTWGFFVNMYSSFVAFLIGVPVALIGLDAVSKAREQTVGELQARRLTESTWRPLVENVHKLATNDLRSLPSAAVSKFVTEWHGLATTMSDFASDPNADLDTEIKTKLENYSDAMKLALDELVATVGNRGVMSHRWISVRTNWEIINSLVRERRLGHALPWLESIEESRLRFYLKNEGTAPSSVDSLG